MAELMTNLQEKLMNKARLGYNVTQEDIDEVKSAEQSLSIEEAEHEQ